MAIGRQEHRDDNTGSNTQDYTEREPDDYGASHLDGLIAAGNIRPTGIHANDTTAWVLNTNNPKKIFAYSRSTGARDTTKDFDIDLPNPVGMWSDGPTLWVTEYRSDTGALRAYTLATGTRLPGQDFENLTAAGNISPFGIWSDGTTMWVADSDDRHLYAYDRVNKTRQMDKELTLSAFDWNNNEINPGGFWMDDTTIWVASPIDDDDYITLVRAIKRSDGSRNTLKDIPLGTAGSDRAWGIWADDETMLIVDGADDKVYSFNLPVPSDDAMLSALTVSPRDIIGFDAERTSYEVGVASTVAEATVAATANDSNADVSFDPQDSNDVTDGHQVALSAGRNTVTITVTAENGSDEQDYTVSVNQGVSGDYGWNAEHDLDGLIAAGNNTPSGVWTDGITVWISDQSEKKIYAYNTDGTRDSDKDFNTLDDAGNDLPLGIWSSGTTMWVLDGQDASIYAYHMSNKMLDNSLSLGLSTANNGNTNPTDIWPTEAIYWVADSTREKIFAYRRLNGLRSTSDEFNTLQSADNRVPLGIWSNGTTMWVSDLTNGKIYAYQSSDKARDSDRDFDTLAAAGNNFPTRISSHGNTMWVVDQIGQKVYAYNMPAPSDDATLSALTVSPKDIIGFDAERTAYEVGVASTLSQATVLATPNDPNAGVSYSGTDADDMTDGHQVDLVAGWNTVNITVTAEDGVTKSETYRVRINRGVDTTFGWKADDDLDGLIAAGQQQAAGIWSNGTTIWVTDPGNKRLTAYNRDGTRNSSEDFNALAEGQNAQPAGIWSNGTTMWVADGHLGNLYAYNMSDKQRDTTKDIRTFILYPGGVWSDGTTIWVLNTQNATILAFNISSRSLDSAKEFNTLVAASNQTPRGIWSDRTTMWVADAFGDKVYAYNMSDKQRDDTKDFNTLSSAGNHDAYGLWSDHTTMWITDQVDRKVYSYNKPLSADNTLSTLTVSPKDITGFDPARTSYEVGVASTVPQATVVARATNGAATVDYSGTDADLVAPGHQVDLSASRNEVTVTVTAQDDSTQDYTVSVNRGVTDDYGWKADDDLDGLIAAKNTSPTSVWGNETTLWVANDGADTDKIYAYNRETMAREPDQDFNTLAAAGNEDPYGIWSDGVTMWVTDGGKEKIFAYNLSTKARDDTKDFGTLTAANNTDPFGIWSNGVTMWVADIADNKLYAYNMSDKQRDDSRDFETGSFPAGIWSDGATMWVVRGVTQRISAYNMSDKQPDTTRDFNTLAAAGHTAPRGIWSDGTTMWVTDESGNKVFSYNLPPSANANLSSLTLSPRDIIGFAPNRTSYEVGVASTVTEATVTAAADHPAATVDYSGTDADDMTDGHQVSLSAGRNTVTVTVTAEDDSTRAYTISINRGVRAQYGWKAGDDLDGLIAADNRGPRGIWGNSSTFYISDFDDDKVYAYNRNGTRDDTKDFDTTGSTFPNGIWSDGTTLWVADSASTTLFAYTLSNGNRNTGAEITLANPARGVWGNSTTIWAVNETTDKLEAYQKSDGTDDNDKDITLDSANADPAGIWSDDTTIWVADHADDKLYAYTLSNGDRDSSKDIDTSTSGNENPRGLWGEGDTIWVTDEDDDRVYSYNLVDNRSSDATLSDLITSPRNILRFDADRTAYEVGVASTVAQATVTATANDAKASVDYSGTDADDMTPGHQVDLSAGRNQVTVTVTAEDDSTKTYRVRINRGVTHPTAGRQKATWTGWCWGSSAV